MTKKRDMFLLSFVLIFLFILLIFVVYSFIKLLEEEKVTGEVTSGTFTVSIVVSGFPTLTIEKPRNETYFNNMSLKLKIQSNGESFWYNLDNGANASFNGSLTYFNVSDGSHTIYVFTNNTGGDVTKTNATFNVDLSSCSQYYNYSKFQGVYKGNSTDFNTYSFSELENLSAITFEHTQFGKINFLGYINATSEGCSLLDFNNVNISFNRIEFNSSALPNFNKSATLLLKNLTFSNPRILFDENVCPANVCSENYYSGGQLSFNTTHFSVYSAEETSSDSGSGSSGGGSGVGSTTPANFSIDKERVVINLKQGETQREEFTITNTGKQKIQIDLISPGINEFVKISEESFELAAGESKIIVLDFFAREDSVPDLYLDKLIVKSGNVKKEILVSLGIESKESLFDVRVNIENKRININKLRDLIAGIELFNFGTAGRADAQVEYLILDKEGKVIDSEKEIIAVETRTSFLRRFNLPPDIKLGRYLFYAKVNYDGETAIASEWFEVVDEHVVDGEITSRHIIYYLVALIMIIILVMVAIKSIKKVLHKVSKSKISERK